MLEGRPHPVGAPARGAGVPALCARCATDGVHRTAMVGRSALVAAGGSAMKEPSLPRGPGASLWGRSGVSGTHPGRSRGRTVGREARPARGRRTVRVVVLRVAQCPLVDLVRATVRSAAATAGVEVVVEEIEGAFASPTLLVEGVDVTGAVASGSPACRLDLPTEAQVRAAFAAPPGRRGQR